MITERREFDSEQLHALVDVEANLPLSAIPPEKREAKRICGFAMAVMACISFMDSASLNTCSHLLKVLYLKHTEKGNTEHLDATREMIKWLEYMVKRLSEDLK